MIKIILLKYKKYDMLHIKANVVKNSILRDEIWAMMLPIRRDSWCN